MRVFAGLGNPGAKYARNRHNIGFMALDAIAESHGIGPWRARFQGQAAEGRLGDTKVLLLKPETYMNLSGQSVAAALGFYKLGPEALTVFHDELDLAPGKLRVKQAGGHAGHNGLRSIHGHLGGDYQRVRIGIGHPGSKDLVSGYVLHDFAKSDELWLDDLLRGIADGAPALANGDAGRFMNAVAQRVTPPRASTGAGAGTSAGQGRKPAAQPGTAPAKPVRKAPAADGARTTAKPPEPTPEPARSPLQRLIDRFR